MPGPYPLPFWSSLVHVGLSQITTVLAPVRIPTHRYLLAGVTAVGLRADPLSVPLHGLKTSRYRGDDAFPFSPGIGDCIQYQVVSYQGCVLQVHLLVAHPPGRPGFEQTNRTLKSTPKIEGKRATISVSQAKKQDVHDEKRRKTRIWPRVAPRGQTV